MKLTMIDGSGYIHRAYHAFPKLSRSDGQQVGAVYGFAKMLNWLLTSRSDHTHIAVIMDGGRSGREKIDPEYKANRGPRDPDFSSQLALIDRTCAAFNVPAVRAPGYEADDVIATYAHIVTESFGGKVDIHSVDKDLFQLIGPDVRIFDPMKRVWVDTEECIRRFGVPPISMPDYQALVGDTADNIPGVDSIGAKTAAALIRECENLDTVLARAQNNAAPLPCKAAARFNLRMQAERARMCLRLVTLMRDVPPPVALDAIEATPIKPDALRSFLAEMEFPSLADEIAQPEAVNPASFA